jgi:hypothetical protein
LLSPSVAGSCCYDDPLGSSMRAVEKRSLPFTETLTLTTVPSQ